MHWINEVQPQHPTLRPGHHYRPPAVSPDHKQSEPTVEDDAVPLSDGPPVTEPPDRRRALDGTGQSQGVADLGTDGRRRGHVRG